MKDFKTKSQIEKVVVHSLITTEFFSFEFDHMPSDEEVKQQVQNHIDKKNIAYSVAVSYQQEHKGNFWDDINKKFYKWNDLMELRNEKS